MDRCRENMIEFLEGEQRATVTFSQGRYKSRIKKLAEERPEECRIVAENEGGSLCAGTSRNYENNRNKKR